MRNSTLASLASVVVGAVVALVSGLIQTPTARLGVDVVYWGVPLPWITRVLPTRFQHIILLNFLADAIFWIAATLVIAISALYLATRSQSPAMKPVIKSVTSP